MKLVTTKFKSGGLHEKQVVATWNLGNHLSKMMMMMMVVVIGGSGFAVVTMVV